MIIVEPIKLGAPPVSSGGGSYYDRDGVLQTAPPNTLRVTYDPSDLSKAPAALIEPEATNLLRYSEAFENGDWGKSGAVIIPNAALAPNGTMTARKFVEGTNSGGHFIYCYRSAMDEVITFSLFAKAAERSWMYLSASNFTNASLGAHFNLEAGTLVSVDASNADYSAPTAKIEPVGGGWYRCSLCVAKGAVDPDNAAQINVGRTLTPTATELSYVGDGVSGIYIWGAQVVHGVQAMSYTPTNGALVTRAADVVGAGAGLVFSNVPIAEAAYDVKATYAKDARVYDPVTYAAFQSLIAGNVGKALDDTSAWSPRGAINRRAMFDDYNNTQTVMPDEILVVLTPEMVAQGIYLGNLDVHELRISMVDALDGIVYSEVISLIESNSQSSYFNWMFKRIKRRTYFFLLDLPVYANALVTISLRKIGAEAKVGMCAIGPVEEFGPSLLGLSTEGKDFSSTTFNFDGTSKTTIRPYAKRMSCDVVIPNDEITYVQDRLFELRQRPLVWVGGPYGATAVFGRYGSFKNVIEYQMQSKMNLMIEGAV